MNTNSNVNDKVCLFVYFSAYSTASLGVHNKAQKFCNIQLDQSIVLLISQLRTEHYEESDENKLHALVIIY